MKNILLLTITFFFGFNAIAQQNPCEPQASLQDSTFGLWPDTTQNLPLAVKEVYYEEHIQIKTPNTVGEVMGDPFYIEEFPIINIAPFNIDSIKFKHSFKRSNYLIVIHAYNYIIFFKIIYKNCISN